MPSTAEAEPHPWSLPDATVHLWVASIADAPAVRRFYPILSAEEQARTKALKQEDDQLRALLARGLVRVLLARYLKATPETVAIHRDADGRPILAGLHADTDIGFSVAHAGGLVLVAFARTDAIGVDVELASRTSDHEGIARRYFAQDEYEALMALPASARAAAFLRGWTRKEAYLKARGRGLNLPLDQFSVSIGPEVPARLVRVAGAPHEAGEWAMSDLDLGEEYIGTLICRAHGWLRQQWDIRDQPDRILASG